VPNAERDTKGAAPMRGDKNHPWTMRLYNPYLLIALGFLLHRKTRAPEEIPSISSRRPYATANHQRYVSDWSERCAGGARFLVWEGVEGLL